MAGLISDQLLRNLRVVANKQLVTPVKVHRMVPTEGPFGTVEVDTIVAETVCWYKPAFKGDLRVQHGGRIANDSLSEFRFDINEDIRVGDKLEVNGVTGYLVQDTSADATIQLYLKVSTQVLE